MQVAFLFGLFGASKAKMKVTIKQLKRDFLKYYSELPNQRLAADHIGRNEDTIILWKNNDPDFKKKVLKTKAEWVLTHVNRVKSPQWLLERIIGDCFSNKTVTDISVNTELEAALDRIAKILPK